MTTYKTPMNRRTNAKLQPNDPPSGAIAINVGAADQVLNPNIRYIYCGGTGDIAVQFIDGTTGTFKAVPTGVTVAGAIVAVLHTGTTASNLLGLY